MTETRRIEYKTAEGHGRAMISKFDVMDHMIVHAAIQSRAFEVGRRVAIVRGELALSSNVCEKRFDIVADTVRFSWEYYFDGDRDVYSVEFPVEYLTEPLDMLEKKERAALAAQQDVAAAAMEKRLRDEEEAGLAKDLAQYEKLQKRLIEKGRIHSPTTTPNVETER